MNYTKDFLKTTKLIDNIMSNFSHSKKDIWYWYRWTFENELRIDLIDYKNKWKKVLRFWRWKFLTQLYPLLHSRFDETLGRIGKIYVKDDQILIKKDLKWVLKLMAQVPKKSR